MAEVARCLLLFSNTLILHFNCPQPIASLSAFHIRPVTNFHFFHHHNFVSVQVRRTDGAFLSESVSPYIATLYHLTTQSHWTQAIRLARFVDVSYRALFPVARAIKQHSKRWLQDKVVWAVLASTAIFEGELESAEISLASIEAVDKLQHIQYIRTLPNKARR